MLWLGYLGNGQTKPVSSFKRSTDFHKQFMLLIVLNYYQSLPLHTQNYYCLTIYPRWAMSTQRSATDATELALMDALLDGPESPGPSWSGLRGPCRQFAILLLYSVNVLYSPSPIQKKRKSSHLLLMTYFGDQDMFWVLLILQVPPDTFLTCSAGLSWFYQASFPFCFVVWWQVSKFHFLGTEDWFCLFSKALRK